MQGRKQLAEEKERGCGRKKHQEARGWSEEDREDARIHG
jgi:hypothetical protein